MYLYVFMYVCTYVCHELFCDYNEDILITPTFIAGCEDRVWG